LEIGRVVYKDDHTAIALALNNIGNTFLLLARYEEALVYHKESLDMLRRIHSGDHADIAASLNNRGKVLEVLGKYEEELIYYTESGSIQESVSNLKIL